MYLKILHLLFHKVYEQRLTIASNQLYRWYHLRGEKHCEQFQYMQKELWLSDSRLSLQMASKYQNYCSKLLLLNWTWLQIWNFCLWVVGYSMMSRKALHNQSLVCYQLQIFSWTQDQHPQTKSDFEQLDHWSDFVELLLCQSFIFKGAANLWSFTMRVLGLLLKSKLSRILFLLKALQNEEIQRTCSVLCLERRRYA